MNSHAAVARVLLVCLLVGLIPMGAVSLTEAEAKALVSDPSRSDEDRKRDERRRPQDFLVFSGVGPGMRVADLGASSGYTTELLARAVGPDGSVYGQNTAYVLEKYVSESWPARLSRPAMTGVVRVDREFVSPLPPEANHLDLITMVYVYHDTLFTGVDRAAMNEAIFQALRPGGALVVVDHVADPGAGAEVAETIHRIDPALLRRELEAAGFRFAAEADFLRHAEDSHDAAFFKMDGPTDSFVHRYIRPE